MAAPYEIVAAPLSVYVADVATAFPDVDETPGAGWTLLGTSGDKNYTDEGVTVNHGQTIETFTPVGTTAPRKAWRTDETLSFGFTLVDLSPAQYALVMNDATITQTPAGSGTPGTSEFELLRGIQVATFALLARGLSTVDDALVAQYEVPMCYQAAEQAPVFTKGTPASLACEFTALWHESDGFGIVNIQEEEAT